MIQPKKAKTGQIMIYLSSYFTALRIISKTFKVIGEQHQLTLVCNKILKVIKFSQYKKCVAFNILSRIIKTKIKSKLKLKIFLL